MFQVYGKLNETKNIAAASRNLKLQKIYIRFSTYGTPTAHQRHTSGAPVKNRHGRYPTYHDISNDDYIRLGGSASHEDNAGPTQHTQRLVEILQDFRYFEPVLKS